MQGTKLACGEGGCGSCAVEIVHHDPETGTSSGLSAFEGTKEEMHSMPTCRPCHEDCVDLPRQGEVHSHQFLSVPCGLSGWRQHHHSGGHWQLKGRLPCRARYATRPLLHLFLTRISIKSGLSSDICRETSSNKRALLKRLLCMYNCVADGAGFGCTPVD